MDNDIFDMESFEKEIKKRRLKIRLLVLAVYAIVIPVSIFLAKNYHHTFWFQAIGYFLFAFAIIYNTVIVSIIDKYKAKKELEKKRERENKEFFDDITRFYYGEH